MAYEMVMPYHLHMPSYFLETFTEYPLSTVGAGFACPKTQSKLFSGERTSPLRTKRWRYPRFDTPLILFNYQFNTIISIPAFAPNSN